MVIDLDASGIKLLFNLISESGNSVFLTFLANHYSK